MTQNYEHIVDQIKNLPLPHLIQTKHLVTSMIKSKHKDATIDADRRPSCVHCGSSIIKKHGKTSNGRQRYACLNSKCQKTFSSLTDSFLYRSKKLIDYLYLMVEYTLDGLSIRNISEKIGIPITTVWTWRAKILYHIQSFIADQTPLSTLIYSDETFIKINMKGTKPHQMPRVSYHTKKPSVAARELVCIQTVIDDTKRTLFNITGVARVNRQSLNTFLKPLLSANTRLVSDGEYAYTGFTLDNDIIHETVIAPDVKSRNNYSLAPINNLHASFKFFLTKYRGVSTKRLEGYINLFRLEFSLNRLLNQNEKIAYLYESLLDLDTQVTNQQIKDVTFPIDVESIYENLRLEGHLI